MAFLGGLKLKLFRVLGMHWEWFLNGFWCCGFILFSFVVFFLCGVLYAALVCFRGKVILLWLSLGFRFQGMGLRV